MVYRVPWTKRLQAKQVTTNPLTWTSKLLVDEFLKMCSLPKGTNQNAILWTPFVTPFARLE